MKILFVCLGNICRSPLAEAIFNHKVRLLDIAHAYVADSCGTSDYHIGELPDIRTRKNAERNGVTITHHGRQLRPDDLESFDLILAMDRSNLTTILQLPNAPHHREKLRLLREFDPEPGDEVPDPYYGFDAEFQQVFEIIDRSVDALISRLLNEKSIRSQ